MLDTPENRVQVAHQFTLEHMDGMVARRVELEDSKRVLEATLWAVRGIMRERPEMVSEAQRIRADQAIRELIDDVLGPDDGV